MKLWHLGILIAVTAAAINGLLIRFDTTGFPRELTRLSILTGLVLLVVGLFRRKK